MDPYVIHGDPVGTVAFFAAVLAVPAGVALYGLLAVRKLIPLLTAMVLLLYLAGLITWLWLQFVHQFGIYLDRPFGPWVALACFGAWLLAGIVILWPTRRSRVPRSFAAMAPADRPAGPERASGLPQ